MKISHNWLQQYVTHDLTPQQLAETLTMSGLEVEDVEPLGASMEGVVVGHVLETRPHPNADRLTLCRVDLGDGEPVQIVCGAPNVAAGQKVPVATLGTTLLLPSRQNPEVREPFTIQKAKLRGEASQGMICAEDELGLGDDHSGILVLDEAARTGQPFFDYLSERGVEGQDAVLDVSITPNRPDATSHLGIARDVAALVDLPLLLPEVTLPSHGGAAARQVAVEIRAEESCPRYVALVVRGVKIQESPAWLKRRLTAIGLRPRNNVVDITNYVMYECGQPLHAFDLDRIAGARIVVREAEAEEPFTTLDGKERKLPQGALLICDAERPVAIAGIMGGENSEVTDETTNLLLESAYFAPASIRRTSKTLGLQTDASYRFERGVDPEGQPWAAARTAALIAELAGGEIVEGMVDAHPRPAPRRVLNVRPSRINGVLGVEVPGDDVIRLLTAIGFGVEQAGVLDIFAEHVLEGRSPAVEEEETVIRCTVPSFRPDVEREIDVIEEVARLYGYARIPLPPRTPLPSSTAEELPSAVLRRDVRALLAGLGYREIYTNSMLRRETAQLFNLPALGGGTADGDVVETLNPISQEMAALRPSLLPGALQVAGFNQNHGQRLLRFMEFGHVFRRTGRRDTVVPGYAENEALLVALSGLHTEAGWDAPAREADFFDLKGSIEALLEHLRIPDVRMEPHYAETAVTAYYLEVRSGTTTLGIAARLADRIADRYDLKSPLFFAELDWDTLAALAEPAAARRFAPVSRFPTVERDLAVVTDRGQAVGPLLDAIRGAGAPLLREVSVFDLYRGERIEPEKQSVAFALRFGADRTLQDQEVDAQLRAIVGVLQAEYGAELRQ